MYILNIGLSNNPAPLEQIIQDLLINCKLDDYQVQTGIYNGLEEQTVVARVEKCNLYLVQKLWKAYNQECIAVWSMDFQSGWLIYNPDYQGEKLSFDLQHFLFLD
jgi:hypothetical protein